MLAKGSDPMAERKREKQAQREQVEHSFRAVAHRWHSWSYSSRSGESMSPEQGRFKVWRGSWACTGGWCGKRSGAQCPGEGRRPSVRQRQTRYTNSSLVQMYGPPRDCKGKVRG